MIGKNNRFFREQGEEGGFWPSFTDLLSVIILVILLFLTIYVVYYTAKLNEVAGIKKNIIDELKVSMTSAKMNVAIDEETGAIIFQERILFDTNKDTIKDQFREMLDDFIPRYVQVLLSEGTRPYIAEIIIEGHTDAAGAYFYNLNLAQRRAYSVAEYILGNKIEEYQYKDDLRDILTVSGIPETGKDDGEVNREERRVEFKFRLKDKSQIQRMISEFK